MRLLATLFNSVIFIVFTSFNSVKGLKTKSIELPLFVLKLVKPENMSSFTDPRDSKVYHEIKIGNQIWMAENLNYGKLVLNMNQSNNKLPEKSFYNNDTILGKQFGALYTWEEACNYQIPSNTKIIQGLCPDGWHLPSDKEWYTLSRYLDGTVQNTNNWSGHNIAIVLLENGSGKFSAKLGGNALSHWCFYLNEMAYFWTSTSFSNASALYRCIDNNGTQLYKGAGDIKIGMSVRCIKD